MYYVLDLTPLTAHVISLCFFKVCWLLTAVSHALVLLCSVSVYFLPDTIDTIDLTQLTAHVISLFLS